MPRAQKIPRWSQERHFDFAQKMTNLKLITCVDDTGDSSIACLWHRWKQSNNVEKVHFQKSDFLCRNFLHLSSTLVVKIFANILKNSNVAVGLIRGQRRCRGKKYEIYILHISWHSPFHKEESHSFFKRPWEQNGENARHHTRRMFGMSCDHS